MKKILWPLIHKFRLNPDVCLKNNSWGWISQNKIKQISNNNIPKNEIEDIDDQNERMFYHKYHFRKGVIQGYQTVYQSYCLDKDFIENCYTTPKLSLAINYLNSINSNIVIPNLSFKNMDINILGSWIETGFAESNDKILGLWDQEVLKHELIAGGLGPEVRVIWDQKPMKQKVRVLYQLSNRIDVWDWERCIMVPDSNWSVSNINNILV